MLRTVTVVSLFLLLAGSLAGQNKGRIPDSVWITNDTVHGRFYLIQKVERDGVVLPEIELDEVTVTGRLTLRGRFEAWRYSRLVHNVKRVYPYAQIVRYTLYSVNEDLKKLPDDKSRREYIKNVEKDVFKDYEADMRSLTITQGRILIKLINRETENTSYELIKEYRSGVTAFFWQGIARIFGTNLKDTYDAEGDDYLIERIITEIELGRL